MLEVRRSSMAGSVRTVELAAQSLLRLPRALETRVTCSSGAVWITQDRNRSDTVLERGQSCRIRGGAAIVEAVRPAVITIETLRGEFSVLRNLALKRA
jgi:hypothetical protein